MSGCDFDGQVIRKGAVEAVAAHVQSLGGKVPDDVAAIAGQIGDDGGTPLAVSNNNRMLGIIHLKDVVKLGMAERFDRFRAMGIRTVMITGDNRRTAAAIAKEAGVDDFLAEATPEAKMRLIKEEQAARQIGGHDRRRHQRRAGFGPSRRGHGHEHRHPGGQGSRQHDRPRFRPHQAP